jgi:hypothetical protein
MTTFVDDLVPDELRALVEPLLPAPPRPPYGGRRRTISDRACSPRSCTWPGGDRVDADPMGASSTAQLRVSASKAALLAP